MAELKELLDTTASSAKDALNVAKDASVEILSATSSLAKSASDEVLSTTSDIVVSATNIFKTTSSTILNKVMENKMVLAAVVAVALVVYCSKISFKLPNIALKAMNNSNMRLAALFGIAYLATKDVPLALLATVALMLTFNRIAIYRNNKHIAKALKGSDLKKLDDSDSDSEKKSPEGSKNDIEAAPVDAPEPESPKQETSETPKSNVSGYGGDELAEL